MHHRRTWLGQFSGESGRVDPKGLYGSQANNSEGRLKRPLVETNDELVEASWDEAMDRIVERSQSLLGEQGPSSIAFYTTVNSS